MNKPPAIALLLVAALFTSCASSSSDSPSPADNESPMASSTPEETPTEPVAREHTDAELIAALPDSAQEFLGLEIDTRCVRMNRVCEAESKPGIAKVQSSLTPSGDKEEFLILDVDRDLNREWQRIVTDECKPGPYDNPSEPSEVGFAAGERGVKKVRPLQTGGWEGSICTRTFRLVDPDGEVLGDRKRHVQIVVSSSHHTLFAYGAGVRNTPDLVTEYVARLEAQ